MDVENGDWNHNAALAIQSKVVNCERYVHRSALGLLYNSFLCIIYNALVVGIYTSM